MTRHRHGEARVEFPNELEILYTRDFEAPIELVFDVLTKPEHVRNWFAAFEDTMKVCSIDLRVGGSYHFVPVTSDGRECSFRGTYLEIESPVRTVATWLFEGWPDADAAGGGQSGEPKRREEARLRSHPHRHPAAFAVEVCCLGSPPAA